MVLSTDSYQRTLQAQHTLEQSDWLNIYAIAQTENNSQAQSEIDSFGFEQFLGFTCHLFVTTGSQQSREQLATILPKFGSIAVFPLLKIAYHFKSQPTSERCDPQQRTQQPAANTSMPSRGAHTKEDTTTLSQLAHSCLKAMPLQALAIGLADAVRASLGDPDIVAIVVMPLIGLIAHYPKRLLLSLSHQLDAEDWHILSAHLIGALSDIKNQRLSSHTDYGGKENAGGRNVQANEPAHVA
ncbi:MAG: hypothetical protein AAFQ95_17745 [Cyanobacteria bacterium J06621_3]